MRYDNQLRYAANIIDSYDGHIPLAIWLKDFFRENKQMGSTDRKTVSAMVYAYYRLGYMQFNSTEERIVTALAACGSLPEIVRHFTSRSTMSGQSALDTDNPTTALSPPFPIAGIFPWVSLLSHGVDGKKFAQSFLQQPHLYLRIRPGHGADVRSALQSAGIHYDDCDDNCVALPNGTKLDGILHVNRQVVIQDKSSQKTGQLLREAAMLLKRSAETMRVWDCCAGSGGKSIMACDIDPELNLTVSDNRASILSNLTKRFHDAGIKKYRSFVLDLTAETKIAEDSVFDIVIADVPCSGSGTWARTPEQLFFFNIKQIDHYSTLQKKILNSAVAALKPGGMLLYITCSVFAAENEEIVNYARDNLQLTLKKMELLKGYEEKADTLFAALLVKGEL